MPSLTTDIIAEIAASPIRQDAENLLSRNHLWNLKEGPDGGYSALVLDNTPEPFLVTWDAEKWSCECDHSGTCVHLASLLLRVAETRKDDLRFSVLSGKDLKPDTATDFDDLFAWDAPQPKPDTIQHRKKQVSQQKSGAFPGHSETFSPEELVCILGLVLELEQEHRHMHMALTKIIGRILNILIFM